MRRVECGGIEGGGSEWRMVECWDGAKYRDVRILLLSYLGYFVNLAHICSKDRSERNPRIRMFPFGHRNMIWISVTSAPMISFLRI